MTRTTAFIAAAACAWTALVGTTASAQEGREGVRPVSETDPFFAGNWVATTSPGPAEERRASQVAVDSRGRVIIGSHARDKSMTWTCDSNKEADQQRNPHITPANVAYLERYLPNGHLDTTFGDNGLVTIPQFAHSQGLRSVGALPDGSVVVLMEGETAGCLPHRRVARDIALRIGADGDWDREWAPQGRMLTELFGVFALAIDRDRILLAGDATLHLWRAGTWSSAALPHRTTTQSMSMSSRWVAINDVNQEVDSEGVPVPTTTANGWLIRNDAGLSQASNPVRFRVPLNLPSLHLPGRSLLAWDSQGRLVAVTSVFELPSAPPEGWRSIEDTYFIVSRLHVDDDGTTRLDTSFGGAGQFAFRPEPVGRPQRYVHAWQVAATPEGGVLVLGAGPVPGFGYVNLALRLAADGTRDDSFGTSGVVPLPNEAIMEGPSAIDKLGRWFGAARDSLATSSETRAKRTGAATVRMSRTGDLAVSNGAGWRSITMSPKQPSRLHIVSLSGCESSGERTVSAVLRVTGRYGKRWIPLGGAPVDMTVPDELGNPTVLVRKRTDRNGYVRLEGTVKGPGPLGFYFGLSNTHLETFRERTCGPIADPSKPR